MTIDTVFKPTGPTALLTNAAAVQVCSPATMAGGISTFRVRNLSGTPQRFAWAGSAAALAGGVVAPTGNGFTGAQFAIGMLPNSVETFELPAAAFYIADNVTGFEFTPGQGA